MASGNNSVTSAFIDLATYDELEKYLYGGKDSVAYFVRCVRKSVWFSMVPVTLRVTSGQGTFDGEFAVNISRAGDYLANTWARVTFSSVTLSTAVAAQASVRWTRNLMHNLIYETWVTFNDLTAMRFDNHWLDFYAAFSIPESKQNGYDNMIGNFDDLINPRTLADTAAINRIGVPVAGECTLPAATLNLPLPYFFTLDTGISLPTAAIPYNDMKLNFHLRNWDDLLIYDEGTAATARDAVIGDLSAAPTLTQVQIWANYAIVSNEERVKMGRCPRDIVIEQVQIVPRRAYNTAANPNSYDIRLSHAVKGLFWGCRNRIIANEWSNYTDQRPAISPGQLLGAGVTFNIGADPVGDHTLIYENTNRLDQMGSDYFSLIQPWYHAQRIPTDTGYHMYSYALKIFALDPMGSTNYGKLTNVSLNLNPTATAGTDNGVFDAIVRGYNFNVCRISGGAFGYFLRNSPIVLVRSREPETDSCWTGWKATPVRVNSGKLSLRCNCLVASVAAAA